MVGSGKRQANIRSSVLLAYSYEWVVQRHFVTRKSFQPTFRARDEAVRMARKRPWRSERRRAQLAQDQVTSNSGAPLGSACSDRLLQ
jgi:hypothetical protein